MKHARNIVCAVVMSLLGIGVVQCGRSYGRQSCRMESESILTVTEQVPLDVDVSALAAGFLAVWSAEDATFFTFLDLAGRSTSRIYRVSVGSASELPTWVKSGVRPAPKTFWPERARASVSAEDIHIVHLGDNVALMLLAPPSEGNPGGAYVAMLNPARPDQARAYPIGPAGEYATRISGVFDGKKLFAVWHDGDLASSKLRVARLDGASLDVEAERTIKGKGILASPVMVRSGGRNVLAWTETLTDGNTPKSFVNIASLSSTLELSSPATVATSRFLYPSPDLAVMGEQIGVTFRDDEDGDDTPEYHFAMIKPNGTPVVKRHRISQADGFRGPSLTTHDGTFLGTTIRSFQQNLLIGINRFEPTGVKLGGEFQVYADKTDFVRVDVAENRDALLMLYAEDRRTSGRVLTGQVRCKDED